MIRTKNNNLAGPKSDTTIVTTGQKKLILGQSRHKLETLDGGGVSTELRQDWRRGSFCPCGNKSIIMAFSFVFCLRKSLFVIFLDSVGSCPKQQ